MSKETTDLLSCGVRFFAHLLVCFFFAQVFSNADSSVSWFSFRKGLQESF